MGIRLFMGIRLSGLSVILVILYANSLALCVRASGRMIKRVRRGGVESREMKKIQSERERAPENMKKK